MKKLRLVLWATLGFYLLSCNGTNKPQEHKKLLAINDNVNNVKPAIKVALLLDTSNSMDGLIDQAKSQLWQIINELSYAKCEHETPNLQIALYEYGNDNLEKSDGYIRQVIGFSSDLDDISERLFSLDTNGGSEFCGAVIKASLKDLKWGKHDNDLNILFIAGNEAFTQGDVSYKNAIADAVEKNVVVNTIFCGDYLNGISGKWKAAATLGQGEYLTINQNKTIVHIATPYDKIIIELNEKLNKTYIRYGHSGKQKKELQSSQDKNAYEMEEAVIVSRAVSKSTSTYNNASWDLVDAKKDDTFSYEKIDKKTLPKALQNKSTAEIRKYVEQKEKERLNIQKEIQNINLKRKKFIAKNKTNNTKDELNSVMITAIKNQAKRKNYSW